MNRRMLYQNALDPNFSMGRGWLFVNLSYGVTNVTHRASALQRQAPGVMLMKGEELVIRRLGSGVVEVFSREFV